MAFQHQDLFLISMATDMLGMLLQARDADTGLGMDDRQVRDEGMTMFQAGQGASPNGLI